MTHPSLVDVVLANYDIQQCSAVTVLATEERVFDALAGFNPQTHPVLQAAFALHDVAAVLCARAPQEARSLSRLGPLRQSAMAYCAPDRGVSGELMLGFVGRFWRPTSPVAMPALENFSECRQAGLTKVVWGFAVTPADAHRTQLTCTLRAKSTSWGARLAFSAYWRLVARVSGAVRVAMLMAIKQAAERGTAPDQPV